jgi:hypothetical protein
MSFICNSFAINIILHFGGKSQLNAFDKIGTALWHDMNATSKRSVWHAFRYKKAEAA